MTKYKLLRFHLRNGGIYVTERPLHCQVEHHVQTKFATPILHAIDSSKIYDIFSTYT